MAKKQKSVVLRDAHEFAIGVKIEYPTLRKSVQVMFADLTDGVKSEGLAHGIKQRLGDAESGEAPALKYAMACRIRDAFLNGSWDLESRDVDTSAIVLAAVTRVKGLKPEEVVNAFEDYTEEKKAEKLKEWRSAPSIKAAIAAIRAEKAAAAAEEADDEEIEL